MCCVFALSQALSGCLHLQLSPSSSKLHRPNPSLSTRPNPSLSSLSSSLSISLTGACYCLLFSETVNGFVLTGIQENAFVICFFFFAGSHSRVFRLLQFSRSLISDPSKLSLSFGLTLLTTSQARKLKLSPSSLFLQTHLMGCVYVSQALTLIWSHS
ncbi:hypothetical protein Bca101_023670 [Brassica carinata]